MWLRDQHLAQVRHAQEVETMPELTNRKATREELELHHARRTQSIELRALQAATAALEPKESIVERASRWLREWMEGLRR